MSPGTIKLIHLSCVALSYALFVVRGIWSLTGSPRLQALAVRVAPHAVDSVLLASAITLAVMLGLSPLDTPWLLTKIAALMVYIVLGSIAIRHGKSHRTKLAAWVAAQGVFFYIVAIAVTHHPVPWLQEK